MFYILMILCVPLTKKDITCIGCPHSMHSPNYPFSAPDMMDSFPLLSPAAVAVAAWGLLLEISRYF